MAYRNPRYFFQHAARDAGVANITSNNAIDAAFPLANLIDDRGATLTKSAGTSTTHHLQVDRGTGSLEEIGRIIIPFGHNLNGINIRVRTATDAGFTADVVTILTSFTVPSTALINLAMDAGTGAERRQRFVRLDFPSANFSFTLPQLFLTRRRVTTNGPDPGWNDTIIDHSLKFPKPSGLIAALELGANQRLIEYTYRALEPSDETTFRDLFTEVSTVRPFFLDPAYDDEPTIWVTLAEPIERSQDHPAPKNFDRTYRRRVSLIEHLG